MLNQPTAVSAWRDSLKDMDHSYLEAAQGVHPVREKPLVDNVVEYLAQLSNVLLA